MSLGIGLNEFRFSISANVSVLLNDFKVGFGSKTDGGTNYALTLALTEM